jgi:hypothetical protein
MAFLKSLPGFQEIRIKKLENRNIIRKEIKGNNKGITGAIHGILKSHPGFQEIRTKERGRKSGAPQSTIA